MFIKSFCMCVGSFQTINIHLNFQEKKTTRFGCRLCLVYRGCVCACVCVSLCVIVYCCVNGV